MPICTEVKMYPGHIATFFRITLIKEDKYIGIAFAYWGSTRELI